MRLDIRYRTRFTYDAPVRESQNELRAAPVSDPRQQLISYRVTTTPASQRLLVHRLLGHACRRVRGARAPRGARGDRRGLGRDSADAALHRVAARRQRARRAVPGGAPRVPAADATRGLGRGRRRGGEPRARGRGPRPREHRARAAPAGRELDELRARLDRTSASRSRRCSLGASGVCQDFAHLAVAMCRSIGIPARYVSGYLFTTDDATGEDPTPRQCGCRPTPGSRPRSPEADGSRSTRRTRPEVGLRHVKIGHGRDYDDVPPLRGVFGGAAVPSLGVTVDIRRLAGASAADARARRGGRPAASRRGKGASGAARSAVGPAAAAIAGGSLQPWLNPSISSSSAAVLVATQQRSTARAPGLNDRHDREGQGRRHLPAPSGASRPRSSSRRPRRSGTSPDAKEFGVEAGQPIVDFAVSQARKQKVVETALQGPDRAAEEPQDRHLQRHGHAGPRPCGDREGR